MSMAQEKMVAELQKQVAELQSKANALESTLQDKDAELQMAKDAHSTKDSVSFVRQCDRNPLTKFRPMLQSAPSGTNFESHFRIR